MSGKSSSSSSSRSLYRMSPPTINNTSFDDLSIANMNMNMNHHHPLPLRNFKRSDSVFSNHGKAQLPTSSSSGSSRSTSPTKSRISQDYFDENGGISINHNNNHRRTGYRSVMSDFGLIGEKEGFYQDVHEGLRDMNDSVVTAADRERGIEWGTERGMDRERERDVLPSHSHLPPLSVLRSSSMNQ